jgi:hypothetical protein
MSNIKSVEDLRAAILHLESLQKQQGMALKSELFVSLENLKPSRIILDTFEDLSQKKEFRWTVLSIGVGFAGALLTRAISQGTIAQPLKKALGYLLVLTATQAVARHPDKFKAAGKFCFDLLRSKRPQRLLSGASEASATPFDRQVKPINRY